MKVVIAGGSGFLGQPLVEHFATRKFDVVVLSRSRRPPRADQRIRDVEWDPSESPDLGALGPWAREIDGADAVVNLAGAGIADRRWSDAYKQELRRSRVASTRSLVAAVRVATHRPEVFIQGSAVGYYGTDEHKTFDESYPPGSDFLGQMCMAWEAEAHPVSTMGPRLVILRSGIALARDGGALKKMVPPFYFFVGGPMGSGRQPFSWIHRDDWIAMVDWAIEKAELTGPLNGTAPSPVTNGQLAAAVGRAVHRPSWLPVPGFALKLLVGEMASVGLLRGQRVVPKAALDRGFVFRYPELDPALRAIYGRHV
jgi:uncharacterized protein (TIGR01777 family)